MNKIILVVIILLVLGSCVATVIADDYDPQDYIATGTFESDGIFYWKTVGANPCNPEAGCTLEWALAQAEAQNGWPRVVTEEFKELVLGASENIILEAGWRGWMTEGWTADKVAYHSDTIADWPAGQQELAWAWRLAFEGTLYTLVRVRKCQNWGGYEEPSASLLVEKPENIINLGAPPIVACP